MAEADNDPKGTNEEPLFSTLLAGSPQLWSVVDEFVRTLPDRIARIQAALHDQSFDQIQSLAGELREAGLSRGCNGIASRAAAIEQAAHDRAIEDLAGRITELTAMIAGIRAQLKNPDE